MTDKIYLDWEIELVADKLLQRAAEQAYEHNEARKQRGLSPDPNAHKFSTAWNAVQIIRQLQRELLTRIETLHQVPADPVPPAIIPDKPIPKTRRKKADQPAS